jgi:hypothetical protein
MEQWREQLVEEIRIAEQARDLLAGSLPEEHTVRLLADEAVGAARDRGAGYAQHQMFTTSGYFYGRSQRALQRS